MKLFRIMDEKYTITGSQLNDKFYKALAPIFKEAIENGATIREVSHIALLACIDLELENVISSKVDNNSKQ